MASVHKLPGKLNWICFYTDRNGKRRCKSTLTRDIIGHESAAVSRNYTHIDAETRRTALDKLPDVTKPANAAERP